jgi:hypothetical protein
VIAALNGVIGDHLAETGNTLAIPMRFRAAGRPLEGADALAQLPSPTGKLLVLVHGSCMSDLGWSRLGHDHGAALARELGYTPVYLHYNSGRHVSTNGRELAHRLEALVAAWPRPLEELSVLAFSMGGLVTRSALHHAQLDRLAFLSRLDRVVFLGTPHHGAPAERAGNLLNQVLEVSPYAAPLARIGEGRSAGVCDLRFGNLLDEDWDGRDRRDHRDGRTPVPLPVGVDCYAIAATTGRARGDASDWLLGDGLVPVASALGQHRETRHDLGIPPERTQVITSCSHLELLSSEAAYTQVRDWLASPRRRT